MAINKSPTNYYLAGMHHQLSARWNDHDIPDGIPQDTKTPAKVGNNSCDITTNTVSVSASFEYDFAPYSINVFAFAPAPSLSALAPSGPGQFVFQSAGQTGASYVLQTSTNLIDWISVATNTQPGNVLDMTNPTTSGTGGAILARGVVPVSQKG